MLSSDSGRQVSVLVPELLRAIDDAAAASRCADGGRRAATQREDALRRAALKRVEESVKVFDAMRARRTAERRFRWALAGSDVGWLAQE